MVVHSDFPSDVRVAREVAAAAEAGFDVTVIALRRDGQPPREQIAGADVHRLPLSHKRGVSALHLAAEYLAFTLLATLRVAKLTLRRPFDVVQVHNPPDFLIVAALVPKLRGARVIFDVHDLSSDMFAMRFPRRAAGVATPILHAVERAATRSSDLVVTVHEPYRAELVRRSVPERKTLVVLNSLAESLLPTPVPPPEQEPFRIVYHGTVTPHYGVALAVEAMAGLQAGGRPVSLEIFGTGDAVGALRERAAELRLGGVVTISDRYLDHQEVLSEIAGASVGIVPNLPTRLNRFALSTKLFEYIALGIPAVCSDLPTLREYFGPDEVMFFTAGDPDALRAALEEIANNPNAAQARADAARRRAQDYSWGANRSVFIGTLRDAVARRERNGRATGGE